MSGKRGMFLLTLTLGLTTVHGVGLDAAETQTTMSAIQHVFVIPMENHDAGQIFGNAANAPYINNTLIPTYARATRFSDELPKLRSEPHYLWMEAGTNAFSDHTFKTDGDPSGTNSTSSAAHLVTQLRKATNGLTWMTYQEDQSSKTGACPVASSGRYAAKHNPFVFFQDVSGAPPSKTNAYCIAHSRPYSSFEKDLQANDMAGYVFITPNLCHDMHGAFGCSANTIKAGDDWLRSELPRIIEWANQHAGVIFITWDEGESTDTIPFLAIGPGVKGNYAGSVPYNHGSIVKSVEEIFKLAVLPSVSADSDLSDLFNPGSFP